MRKLICILISLALCAGLALSALAAETRFIPSYGLEVIEATKENEDVKDCVVATSVGEAEEKTTDISQEERDLLVEVYEALTDGTMILPVVGDYQFVELMDVHFAQEGCRNMADHTHDDDVAGLTMKFDMEIEDYDVLVALTYTDEKWEPVKSLVDNGDGTITITFEKAGPVVILNFTGEGEVVYDYYEMMFRFTPSVSYKDAPVIEVATMNGEDVEECVVVTSIKDAEENTTDLSQEDRDFLLEIYEKLEDGTMTLPLKGPYVIRDLVDVSFAYEGCCQDEKHGNKDENLAEEGVKLSVTFELDVEPDEDVFVLTYVDEEWVLVSEVENNGDGTVTCSFEDICPVVFAVADEEKAPWNPSTGDAAGNQLVLVVCVMMLSAVGIVTLVATKAKKVR